MKGHSVCTDETLARSPINDRTSTSKGLKETRFEKMGENEISSSNVHPEVSTSDESQDNTDDNIEENTQPKSGSKKIEKPPPKEKGIQSSLSETNIILCSCLAVGLVAIIAIFFSRNYLFTMASDSDVTEPLTANKVVKALQQKFSGQSDLSLKIIKKSIDKIINGTDPKPTQPSILLLMSSKEASETGSRFARELAYLISLNQTNYSTINGHDLKDTNTDDANKFIDGEIKSACDKHKPAVVLLQDLDMLPAHSIKVLFSYCDHENAPCKKAVFIMTISTREDIPESADSRAFDGLAESHLRQSWHYMSKDMLSPLLSRITVSVVGIFADKTSK